MKLVYRLFNALHFFLYVLGSKAYNAISLSVHNINYQKDIIINGYPKFNIHKNGKLIIGNCFKLNSGNVFNSIGRNQRSLISVGNNASLEIGNNVGMSSVAIVCQKLIYIGDNVRIGGNTIIYDTDFHSLEANERTAIPELTKNIKTKNIRIDDNVFIGGHSIILKGSSIGKNSIIGAGSVVSGEIPANEIWGGNPAKFIRSIS